MGGPAMANPEHLEILKQGVEVWNRWRINSFKVQPDLSGAELRRKNFRGTNLSDALLIEATLSSTDLSIANLSNADLTGANLSRTNLVGAECIQANLTNANLFDSDLFMANLTWTNLSHANLYKSDLTMATLTGSDFSEVNLEECTFSRTVLCGVNLGSAINIEMAEHVGPSYIDISTLYRSGGNIPKSFLRGCGLPENFIQYLSSLTGKAFDFYSCFISYSSKDQDFAERLHADLQNKGVRCWFAPEDMKIGDKIRDRIDQSIKRHDKLLLVLSDNSINSEWVEDEVESAYEQEQKRGQIVLFPIRLDDAVMDTDKGWAAKLRRSRNIGDFTKWKDHDSYQKALDRLLRDLKAETE
jgi:uncharacterized protein YjbI with pentapeptide repeats